MTYLSEILLIIDCLLKTQLWSGLKKLAWVMLGGVVTLFLLNFSLVFLVENENTRGTFGDQFGAVNALFSVQAFAGLIYTIILQSRDLELQRNDLFQVVI